METVSLINSMAETRPNNAIVIKQSKKKVCKNRIEMPFKELITYLSKKLEGYAMSLSSNNYDDAQDLIQTTILKLMNNKAKLMNSDQPMSYAKRILKNNFIDNYRMLGAGNSYEEIQEVVENISMANLRVKASRARIRLANCMGKKL